MWEYTTPVNDCLIGLFSLLCTTVSVLEVPFYAVRGKIVILFEYNEYLLKRTKYLCAGNLIIPMSFYSNTDAALRNAGCSRRSAK